jgi:O-antigen ligase
VVDFLFYTLLILLPTQLGKHFWPEFALVSGIRVDYLSPTIYFTDVILLILLGLWFLKSGRKFKRSVVFLIFAFVVFFLLNFLWAGNSAIVFCKFIKSLELVFFSFYIAKNITSLIQVKRIVLALSIGVLYESLIALAQFLTQSSLSLFYLTTYPFLSFGFWLLGERSFNSTTLGIAQAVLDGELFLRPYATFPHPNVLAGFVVVVLTLVLGIRSWEPASQQVGSEASKKKTYHGLFVILYSLFIILALSTLLITFSRSAWLVGLLVFVGSFLIRHLKRPKKALVPLFVHLLFIGFLFSVSYGYIFSRIASLRAEDRLSVSRRIELNKTALRMIKTYPFFGVGLGNFIIRLSEFSQSKETIYWLQPVHNIFLLVAAEGGLLSWGVFLWLLFLTYKRLLSQLSIINYQLSITLTSILALGLFDHYWLTLQQSQLLLALVLGLCWAKIDGGVL